MNELFACGSFFGRKMHISLNQEQLTKKKKAAQKNFQIIRSFSFTKLNIASLWAAQLRSLGT